jgi:hypothetical protein
MDARRLYCRHPNWLRFRLLPIAPEQLAASLDCDIYPIVNKLYNLLFLFHLVKGKHPWVPKHPSKLKWGK